MILYQLSVKKIFKKRKESNLYFFKSNIVEYILKWDNVHDIIAK